MKNLSISCAFTAAAVAAALGLNPAASAAHLPKIFNEASTSQEELEQRLVTLNAESQGIRSAAENASRELTEEENSRIAAIYDEFSSVEARLNMIDQRSRAQAQAQAPVASGRKTSPSPLPQGRLHQEGIATAAAAARNGVVFSAGTRDFSVRLFAPRAEASALQPAEYFNALATRTFDPRMATATEGIGVDGGFDVPQIWYRGLIDQALQGSEFAQRCRIFPAESNTLTIPILDTKNRNAGVAGLLARWTGEASQQTPQTMKWRAIEMKLRKTFILSEASSELVEDGISYEAQLNESMSLATAQALDAAILYGSGNGQPLGIVNSPGAIQIAAEGGQAADTVVWLNLVNMYARLTPAAQKRAVWFVSPQVLPSLMAVKVPSTDAPALLSGGFSDAGAGTPAMSIFGRPVVVTEIAGQLGDVGDIVFADMSQYGLLMKRSARMENSNAPGFDRDVIQFRMIMRVDGLPLWPTPITPFNGGNTLTWATYLAAR